MNNISIEKEVIDSYRLAKIIMDDKWVDSNTIIVNCSPDYSSIMCQLINHRLSINNKHELYEQLTMEMPYPNMSQIWNRDTATYQMFDKYIVEWFSKIDKSYKYLFLDSATIRGKNFSKVKMVARDKVDYKLGSLYVDSQSITIPHYYVEQFSSENGPITFEWENPLNPNWK